jgi:hypothetical protein
MGARLVEKPIAQASSSARRSDEDRAVLFLQRLCAKNETASFYGPLFWARLDPAGERYDFVPGDGHWLSRRDVYVEHWATSSIARTISADPEVHPYLRPRLNPACRLAGSTLHYPVGRQIELNPAQRQLIEQADGSLDLSELRARDPQITELLLSKRILEAELLVPTVLRCDEALQRQVAELPTGCAGRARWLERLGELDALRERYRAGDLAERRATRALLDERFREWTASEPRRGQGRMFVGRNVVHEVCARNVARLELGPLVAEVERALAPMCELARFALVSLARSYEQRIAEVLAPRLAEPRPLGLLEALRTRRPHEKDVAPERALEAELLATWTRAVGERYREAQDELELADEDIERLLAALPARDDAMDRSDELMGADFHSPDLLLASSSVEAIRRGDYRVVLGELHAGVLAVASPMYLPSCPWPELLDGAARQLAPDTLLHLVDPPETYNYGDLLWPDVPTLREVVHEGACARFRPGLAISELLVVVEDGRLYVQTVDGRLRQRLLSLYYSFLHRKLFALPLVPYEGARGSRVRWGRLILRRRSWRFDAAAQPSVDSTAARTFGGYLRLRRWQRARGLPDRIFVKLPTEPKPVLVDFRSPLLCAAWLRLAGKSETGFSASEMMPAPEEMWLVDGRGRFSSELRFTLTCR